MFELDEDDLEHLFGEETARRGQRLYLQGMVRQLDASPARHQFTSSIKGSRALPYSQNVSISHKGGNLHITAIAPARWAKIASTSRQLLWNIWK